MAAPESYRSSAEKFLIRTLFDYYREVENSSKRVSMNQVMKEGLVIAGRFNRDLRNLERKFPYRIGFIWGMGTTLVGVVLAAELLKPPKRSRSSFLEKLRFIVT